MAHGIDLLLVWLCRGSAGMAAENPELNYAWPGPMAIYLGTKMMLYCSLFFVLWPAVVGTPEKEALVGWQWNLSALFGTVGLFYYWGKAHVSTLAHPACRH